MPANDESRPEAGYLAAFAGADEQAARDAWGSLWVINRPKLARYLRAWLDDDQREDVIQDTFLKLWEYRPRFQDQGIAAWHGLMYRTAYHCYIDHVRAFGGAGEELNPEEIPDQDLPAAGNVLDSLCEAIEQDRLNRCADVLFLGLPENLAPAEADRRLLAAQLFYIDEAPWEEVVRLVSPSAQFPLTRETLDEWISHHGLLRWLAYSMVYYSNHDLTVHLLGLEECTPTDLDELMRMAVSGSNERSAPPGWTWPEVAVILWRYRHGLAPHFLLQRSDCKLTSEDIQHLSDRLGDRMPFRRHMQRMVTGLDRRGLSELLAAMRTPGLWQRLAFQYRYQDELAHLDILERMQPASAPVQHEVTSGMLTVWLSNGRLIARLARFCHDTE